MSIDSTTSIAEFWRVTSDSAETVMVSKPNRCMKAVGTVALTLTLITVPWPATAVFE